MDASLLILACAVIAPLYVIALRALLLRQTRALMMQKAVAATAKLSAEPGSAEPHEVETQALPALLAHDAEHPVPQAAVQREALVAQARGLFRRVLRVDALAAAGYLLLPGVLQLIFGRDASGFGIGLAVALGYVLIALLRYALYRGQFRALDTRSLAERIAMGLVWLVGVFVPTGNVHVMQIVEVLTSPRLQTLIAALYLLFAFGLGAGSGNAAGIGLMLAAVVHAALAWRFFRAALRLPGKRLVVLRVFGMDAYAQYTFGVLLGFWRHFGHFFTIVDQALWRQRNPLWSWQTFVQVWLVAMALGVGYLVISVTALFVAAIEPLETALIVVYTMVLLGGAAWLLQRRQRTRTVAGAEQLAALFTRLEQRPRRLDLTFHSLQTTCHDDTWRMAVAEFVRRADVVLMDLRGFSQARQGCQWEVNFLLDEVPLERVVFLLDGQGDHAAVGGLIAACWAQLRADSPNLREPPPALRFYVARDAAERDVQGVLDLVIQAAMPGGGTPG